MLSTTHFVIQEIFQKVMNIINSLEYKDIPKLPPPVDPTEEVAQLTITSRRFDLDTSQCIE